LAAKHYGQIDRMVLLRAIAAAAGKGFRKEDIEELASVDRTALGTAITETEAAARKAVDFLTTEIGTPTAEALPYLNQLAVVVEIFRRVPKPTAAQYTEIRSWFWSTALTGYFDGWNARQMIADMAAIERFAGGARKFGVSVAPPSTTLWRGRQYRRDAARTKALALMLAVAGPRDLRTGIKIDVGRALALANEVQFHHFFPKNWLLGQHTSYEDANILANIVMLTAVSNQQIADQSPATYLADELAFCDEAEMRRRLDTLLVSSAALEAAMANDYLRFIEVRCETLLSWALDLMSGERVPLAPRSESREVARQGTIVEVEDYDSAD
jgi:hypothetical protein